MRKTRQRGMRFKLVCEVLSTMPKNGRSSINFYPVLIKLINNIQPQVFKNIINLMELSSNSLKKVTPINRS